LFSLVLFAGVGFKKGLIKYIFNNTIQLSDENWIKFSSRFAIFFLFLAILNEVIWRNFSEDFWVKFKVFGMLPITFLFITSQLPFLYKNKVEEEKES
jgi:intracellular septation protein